MSTDYQSARVALGARLRSLREAGLDGKGICGAPGLAAFESVPLGDREADAVQ
ncbi:hypothetical protein [Streptomyces sp. NPDC102487]|uniref:hypothetical protein n=1 Tax=Streptomyces sp. NPDC102487 TaxID=3366182 RepID=UPI00380DF0A0